MSLLLPWREKVGMRGRILSSIGPLPLTPSHAGEGGHYYIVIEEMKSEIGDKETETGR